MDHLQAVPLSFVLVLPIQLLHFCVLDKRIINGLAALDIQLQIHVALLSRALVIHIDALHKVECVPLKQVIDSSLNFGVLKEGSTSSSSSPWMSVTMLHHTDKHVMPLSRYMPCTLQR